MKNKLTLSTDRKTAAEGDFVEIRWACDACPDSLSLAIDSGYEKYSFAVADSGSTRIPMKRSKGKTIVTLNAVISNKKVSKSVEVRVRNTRYGRQSNVSLINKLKMWKEKIQAGWYVFRAQLKYWWLSRKKWQKALWIGIFALWLWMLISSLGNRPDKTSAPVRETAFINVCECAKTPLFADC